jgi:hypothetical protein
MRVLFSKPSGFRIFNKSLLSFLSFHAIHGLVKNIYEKLHVNSQGGSMAKALKHRMVWIARYAGTKVDEEVLYLTK